MASQIEQIHEHLFSGHETRVYAILDGASIRNLLQTLEENQADYVCLYRGELDPELAETAPYLIMLAPNTALTEWVLNGFGAHWGVFAVSKSDMREMRKHFRKFLMVYDPDGKPLYFRYYDPRVLRTYLPTCNREETQTVFGPVVTYFMEGEQDGILLRFVATEEKPVSSEIRVNI